MKNLKIHSIFSFIIVCSMLLTFGCIAFADSSNDKRYDEYSYEMSYLWEQGIADYFKTFGVEGMDFAAFCNSEIGEYALNGFLPLVMNGDNYATDLDNEQNAAYWESLGMRHEAHDQEDPARMWTSLTPISAYTETDTSRLYPVLFVWHGNDNPILLAEGYGFGEIAAEKEWIVVFPWADNDDIYLEEFDRILDVLNENYPVDTSRIYTTGFSKGSRVSQRLSIERKDRLAAAVSNCAKCSAAFSTFVEGIDGLTEEVSAKDRSVPIAFYGGELDHGWPMVHETESEIAAVNTWLSLHGHSAEQSIDKSRSVRKFSEFPAEREMGLQFDLCYSEHADGIDYWTGAFIDENGDTAVRFTVGVGAIHWPTKHMCELAFDFLERFTNVTE